MLNIELRKISHNQSLSEETNAYTAQVWADGVHICDVSNHGHGGCDMQHPAKGKTHADVDALNAKIKAERGSETTDLGNGKSFEMEIDLETVCGELLTAHLISKDLKRSLASKILFQKPGEASIYEVKKPKGQPCEPLIEAVKKKHNCQRTLNEMTFDEALAIYKTAA